jgi:glycosyltransferase involved in cell wall biosynthesis
MAIEPTGEISHVFGGLSSWHLLRALGRRPIVVTAVTGAGHRPAILPRAPAVVAVESETLIDEWRHAGIPADRIRIIHPGVDLNAHVTLPPSQATRLQILFASSPSSAAEFAGRGVPLLVGLAQRRPDIDILIPWRQWGDVGDVRQALAALRPPPNLMVRQEDVADMRQYYAQAHATVVPFGPQGGKACPNSVLEGLACGRPTLATENCGIAPLLYRAGAAVVSEPTVEGLSSGIDRLRADLPLLTRRARQVAEEHFDITGFRRRYEQLYEELTHGSGVSAHE